MAMFFFSIIGDYNVGKNSSNALHGMRDKFSSASSFAINVSIIDKEPPYYTNCPQDVEVKFQRKMLITWSEKIVFKDNSGKDPVVVASPASGSQQLTPGEVTVSCSMIILVGIVTYFAG